MESLASYIYRNLDRMADITPHMEQNLLKLFKVWDANNITAVEFKNKFGFAQDDGIFAILPFMTEYATDPEFNENYQRSEMHAIAK